MTALFDTCVVIDALQDREPFAENAQKIFYAVANKHVVGYISANSVTDIYYLTRKATHSEEQTRKVLKTLLGLFDVLDTTSIDCRKALSSQVVDYEDAVMCETALRSDMDCIVTRNGKDYVQSEVKVYTPEEFLEKLRQTEE